MAKREVREGELKRIISNDTNDFFSRNQIERDPRITPFVSFLKSVASGATKQTLSNTLAKLCKLGFRHKRLFCSRAEILQGTQFQLSFIRINNIFFLTSSCFHSIYFSWISGEFNFERCEQAKQQRKQHTKSSLFQCSAFFKLMREVIIPTRKSARLF